MKNTSHLNEKNEGKLSFLENLYDHKDSRSTTSSSNLSIFDERKQFANYFKISNRTMSFIFPLVYFFTSTLFLFILLFVNVYKDHKIRDNFEKFPMNPFPGFSTLKQMQPKIYSISILIISISGFLNVWFFCSLLLQRFSVPELRSNKLTVHLMFILGIFANIIYIFFGFSPDVLLLESNRIKILKISLSMIIFLSFVFFNTLFATLTLKVFQNFRNKIAFNDKRLQRNIRTKKYVVYLALFISTIYISSIYLNYYFKTNSCHSKLKHDNECLNGINLKKGFTNSVYKIVQTLLFTLPYFLFILNAFINLTYYFDIRYLDNVINMIIDREFFLESEETNLLLSEFPNI